MCHCALVSSIPSQCMGLFFGCVLFWCSVSLGAPVTISLIQFYFIMIFIMRVVAIIGFFMAILYFLKLHLRLSVTKYSWLFKCATPWMFRPLDIRLEYCIEHVTFGLLYVMFTFHTRISYRGVPGFATDCPCGVWCRGLTTRLLYVGPLFLNLV